MQMVLKPITKQNRAEALALHVAKGQEGFVESVAQCLKEADEYDVWRPVALYAEGKMVGFAMYGFFPMYLPADLQESMVRLPSGGFSPQNNFPVFRKDGIHHDILLY